MNYRTKNTGCRLSQQVLDRKLLVKISNRCEIGILKNPVKLKGDLHTFRDYCPKLVGSPGIFQYEINVARFARNVVKLDFM